jgi:hypothetical protein
MNPSNSSSESDSFSDSNLSPNPQLVLFRPEQAYSQIVSTSRLRRRLSKFQRLSRLWENLINALAGRSEPQIHRKRDRQGNWYFQVYDPVSRRSATLFSEREMRAWIDQRYYE